jgi:hypothetical protein
MPASLQSSKYKDAYLIRKMEKKKERSGDRSNRLKSTGHSPTQNRIKSQTFDYNTFYIIVSCQKSNFIKQKTQPPL